jgi:Lrp/AsnC family transcriptional regulator
MSKLDSIDLKMLTVLQLDGRISQRDLADRVGISQNACWRRLQHLNESGIISGTRVTIDARSLGQDLTVFVMIKTPRHSAEWSAKFSAHVKSLPEVIDFHRIGGEWDYLIKVVTRGMQGYDRFYQRLVTDFELSVVSGLFSMEPILDNRPLDLNRLR